MGYPIDSIYLISHSSIQTSSRNGNHVPGAVSSMAAETMASVGARSPRSDRDGRRSAAGPVLPERPSDGRCRPFSQIGASGR